MHIVWVWTSSARADVILWNNSPYGKRWSEVVSIATWCLSASHLANEHIYCWKSHYQRVIDYPRNQQVIKVDKLDTYIIAIKNHAQ